MQQQGILKSDELITRFIRASAQLCVEITYGLLKNYSNSLSLVRAQCFKTLDAYVKLIVMLIKLSGDASNTVTKINLLNKVPLLALFLSAPCITDNVSIPFFTLHLFTSGIACLLVVNACCCLPHIFIITLVHLF